jgi:hypothetical protein
VLKPRKDGVTSLHLAACTNDVHVLNFILKAKSTSSIDLISDDVTFLLYFSNLFRDGHQPIMQHQGVSSTL